MSCQQLAELGRCPPVCQNDSKVGTVCDCQPDRVAVTRPITGVRSVSRPGRWIVPPWPEHARVHEIVRRFSNPLVFFALSRADEKAYYLGYLRALDAASTDDLTCEAAWRWYRELRDCVAVCAAHRDDDDTETDVAREKRAS